MLRNCKQPKQNASFNPYIIIRLPVRAQPEDDAYGMQNIQVPGNVECAKSKWQIHKQNHTTYSNTWQKPEKDSE